MSRVHDLGIKVSEWVFLQRDKIFSHQALQGKGRFVRGILIMPLLSQFESRP